MVTANATANTTNTTTDEVEKLLRWKSRRGWLELDISLQQFWDNYAGRVSVDELTTLKNWLAMDDPQLWALLQEQANLPSPHPLAVKIIKQERTL